ncbi:hypothetical protein CRENBAI_007800 [Crenichthys baileyi]|uniref:Uncharacterized protein n=1 Tax=Crenichthys baileyi TaxID=28760 RepID=A0AAV9RMJ7_9TELE
MDQIYASDALSCETRGKWPRNSPPRPVLTLSDVRASTSVELRMSKCATKIDDPTSRRSVRLASCLNGPFSLVSAPGKWKGSLRTPPILQLSVAEVALPSPWLPPPRHPARLLQWSPPILSLKPIFRSPSFDVFFYSSHPTIFPASFISSMDSLQSFISSFTQLLGS